MSTLTRLRSLAESLNSPQSKRRETMAGVLYEARREVAGILAEMEWRDISTAPRDGTPISVWHKVWKCPLSVRSIRLHTWVEVTLTTQWPDEAFTHWKPLPEPPVLAVKTDGDRNE